MEDKEKFKRLTSTLIVKCVEGKLQTHFEGYNGVLFKTEFGTENNGFVSTGITMRDEMLILLVEELNQYCKDRPNLTTDIVLRKANQIMTRGLRQQKWMQGVTKKVKTFGGSILGMPMHDEAIGMVDAKGEPIKAGDILAFGPNNYWGVCYYCSGFNKPFPYGVFRIDEGDYLWDGFLIMRGTVFDDEGEPPLIVGNIRENIDLITYPKRRCEKKNEQCL